MRKIGRVKRQMLQGRSCQMGGDISHSNQLTGVTLGLHFHVQFRVNECHTKVAKSWQYVSRRFRTVKQTHQGATKSNPSMLCNSPIISIYLYTKLHSCNAMEVILVLRLMLYLENQSFEMFWFDHHGLLSQSLSPRQTDLELGPSHPEGWY